MQKKVHANNRRKRYSVRSGDKKIKIVIDLCLSTGSDITRLDIHYVLGGLQKFKAEG